MKTNVYENDRGIFAFSRLCKGCGSKSAPLMSSIGQRISPNGTITVNPIWKDASSGIARRSLAAISFTAMTGQTHLQQNRVTQKHIDSIYYNFDMFRTINTKIG